MASSKVERKLAAIMFTDIAGYTALSAKDETKALKLLDIQKQILKPIIEEFNGTLHKEMGDGLLFTFPTVSEAVKCGIKIQAQTKSSEDLNLRIGIHEGEVTLKDNDVLGDDVNVASRIEPFSAIGGIAVSGKVQQNISSLTELTTSKNLIQILDMMGRETSFKPNTTLIYVYDDGSIEKVFSVEY